MGLSKLKLSILRRLRRPGDEGGEEIGVDGGETDAMGDGMPSSTVILLVLFVCALDEFWGLEDVFSSTFSWVAAAAAAAAAAVTIFWGAMDLIVLGGVGAVVFFFFFGVVLVEPVEEEEEEILLLAPDRTFSSMDELLWLFRLLFRCVPLLFLECLVVCLVLLVLLFLFLLPTVSNSNK